jgi:hypothetical protein
VDVAGDLNGLGLSWVHSVRWTAAGYLVKDTDMSTASAVCLVLSFKSGRQKPDVVLRRNGASELRVAPFGLSQVSITPLSCREAP